MTSRCVLETHPILSILLPTLSLFNLKSVIVVYFVESNVQFNYAKNISIMMKTWTFNIVS